MDGIRLLSRKATDALYIAMETVPGGIGSRSLGPATSGRRACVLQPSARRSFLVQRAALETRHRPRGVRGARTADARRQPRSPDHRFLWSTAQAFVVGWRNRGKYGQRLIVRLMHSLVEDPAGRTRLWLSRGGSSANLQPGRDTPACSAMVTEVTMGSWTGASASAFWRGLLDPSYRSGLDGCW